jgi:serine/threonine protein kinase
MLWHQLIQRFKYMHEKHFIHRDVKPENFLMGLNDKSGILHVVDMGLAKRYFDPTTKKHLAYRNDKSLTGTARYASVHAHMGEELSRRDDFEAIGYTIVYLYTGFLPWQNLWMEDKKERYEKIKEMKVSISNDELCYGCPPEFVKYMEYVKSLEFE